MLNLKKITLALAVIFLIGATPAVADPLHWSGSGDEYEWEVSPGYFVYPWLNWHAYIGNGTILGEWEEPTGKNTTYPILGSITSYYTGDDGDTYAHGEGDWCIDFGNGTLLQCGWFSMEFNMTAATCEGVWGFKGDETIIGEMWGTGY